MLNNMCKLSELQQGLQMLDCQASEAQLNTLQAYLALLHRWNKVYNLTAVRNPADMLPLHLFDSLSVAKYIQGNNCLDVGSGAGLPGIPLAVMQPERQFTLLDTNGKKTRFIQQAIIELQLSNVNVVQTRVEEWSVAPLFDAIISRAFASIDDFAISTVKHLRVDGCLYAMKGQLNRLELDALAEGFVVQKIRALTVPMLNSERNLVEIRTALR